MGASPRSPSTGPRRPGGEGGQAQIELVAAVPLLLAVALILLQLMSVGYAQSLADGSAEAGAIAASSGTGVEEAVRAALPGWAGSRVDVEVDGGRVAVALRPPALVPGLADRLEVSSTAWSRPAGT